MTWPVSFMTANLWAREIAWDADRWMEGYPATAAWYAPIETYEARFGELLTLIDGFAVDAIDVWVGHLDPAWATDAHIAIAAERLKAHGRPVASYAGSYGEDLATFERACTIASGIGAPILGGDTGAWAKHRTEVLALLERHDLVLAFENHPQHTSPADIRALIGDAPADRVGTAVDTGWWGTNGVDAADAITALADRVRYVHVKDVLTAGEHIACTFGEGVVPIERCVRALEAIGYQGTVSVELGNDDRDPSAELRESIGRLRGWMVAA